MATMQEMIEAVKNYAKTHYNEGGWDSIVECYEDADIAEEIEEGKCNTVEEAIAYIGKGCKVWEKAIAYIGKGCKVWHDYRMDIQAEAFRRKGFTSPTPSAKVRT